MYYAVLTITSGHRTIFGQLSCVSGQCNTWPEKMSGQKRTAVNGDLPPAKKAKRGVTTKTVDKWITDNDKMLNTVTWLKYSKSDHEHVATLLCSVCTRFNDRLRGVMNYNQAYIVGSTNLRTSSFKEHVASDMHQRAMVLLKKSQCTNVAEYAPIARMLTELDAEAEMRLKRKFELAYFICKENLAFAKMGPLCTLEEQHGVDLGLGYKNDKACVTFVEYIAQERRELLTTTLARAKFFSVQSDGSTDAGNAENELFLVLYHDPHAPDGRVHVRDRFLTVQQPVRANAKGLFNCFTRALDYIGVADWEEKLIGFGCDGASVNIGAHGLRGFLENSVPWVVVFWCLAHRLELSLKGALKNTFYMLLRGYYLYEKSPKKCRKLDEVVVELKLCLEPGEMPDKGGNRPLRACGTRFVSHKVAALGKLIDRYGAYLSHLTSLTEDSTIKASDKQKLKGYILKWRDAKMIFGCALFHDLLKPSAILCKVLQDDEVCVVSAIEAVLKTNKAIDVIKTTAFDDLPTIKKVNGIVEHKDAVTNYQGADLASCELGLAYLKSHKDEYRVDCVLLENPC